jgi:hypothetical protein
MVDFFVKKSNGKQCRHRKIPAMVASQVRHALRRH